jgi:trimeric autotransporter adhesin
VAQFALKDNHLDITASDKTIINWKNFSIAPDEVTRFLQDSAHAAVLNRVTGELKSALMGSLQSNGKVYLINQHDILIGKDAVIDTASFVVSTQDVLDEQFLNVKSAIALLTILSVLTILSLSLDQRNNLEFCPHFR